MIVNENRVNLEIQVEDEGNFVERAIFHLARIYSSALPAGEDYSSIPKVIIIGILDFELFQDSNDVHSEYYFEEARRKTRLTDKCAIHFLELPKMPDVDTIDYNNEKDLWLALFNAETEEELQELSEKGGAVMSEAIGAYREIAIDEEFKSLEWMRKKQRHDEDNALGYAKKQVAKERDEFWGSVVADKDSELAEKDNELAEKDNENAELRAQLAKLQAQIGKN